MKILKEQINDVTIFNKISLGTLNFYPLKFKLNNVSNNLKSLDELFDMNLVQINGRKIEERTNDIVCYV